MTPRRPPALRYDIIESGLAHNDPQHIAIEAEQWADAKTSDDASIPTPEDLMYRALRVENMRRFKAANYGVGQATLRYDT